ncbi:probable sporulation protein, polysaccharide deacetylase family [Marininema mesophilum]|uniref:Probable sporulation protein, polysaccharide deacetylase family n=1 Tax=Marininema mesophilum TaxID=1048340 RepID=A0A1H2SMH4_9BACL|nr:polysaccharide deacetylase family protein [Marininema mesophilum]SDW32826.1 probable sporulation protein, polysaccharide deacetylase family [Marininema mesophilum]
MKKKQLRKRWLLIFVPLIWLGIHSSTVTAYVDMVKKGEAQPAFTVDELHERIAKESEARAQKPINARVDRVWKAIPGYNGRVVDREATYRIASKQKLSHPNPWIYREIPPKVGLDDLSPSPIYRGNEKKSMVALMINVAWGTEHLSKMLSTLKQEHVRVTFFLDGSWLKKHETEARAILAEGHEIGNHAYTHPMMSRLDRGRMDKEIRQTESLIRRLGTRSRFFAPPGGDFNQMTVDVAHDLGMKTVMWTVDTVDWRKTSSPAWMISRVRKGVGNGTLILMHPTDRTAIALPQIIRTVKQKGIKLGTVAEVLSSKRIDPVESKGAF